MEKILPYALKFLSDLTGVNYLTASQKRNKTKYEIPFNYVFGVNENSAVNAATILVNFLPQSFYTDNYIIHAKKQFSIKNSYDIQTTPIGVEFRYSYAFSLGGTILTVTTDIFVTKLFSNLSKEEQNKVVTLEGKTVKPDKRITNSTSVIVRFCLNFFV